MLILLFCLYTCANLCAARRTDGLYLELGCRSFGTLIFFRKQLGYLYAKRIKDYLDKYFVV